jgi:hypothetical protein
MAAAPIPDPKRERARHRVRLQGEAPSPMDPKSALRFLPSRLAEAATYVPRLREVAAGHLVSEFDEV